MICICYMSGHEILSTIMVIFCRCSGGDHALFYYDTPWNRAIVICSGCRVLSESIKNETCFAGCKAGLVKTYQNRRYYLSKQPFFKFLIIPIFLFLTVTVKKYKFKRNSQNGLR